jgi:hypothetical protein
VHSWAGNSLKNEGHRKNKKEQMEVIKKFCMLDNLEFVIPKLNYFEFFSETRNY